MDIYGILAQILELCIVPLLGILTTFIVQWLMAKKNKIISETNSEIADKYYAMIFDTVANCVIATNQTYTDTLKKNGAFTVEAQQIAFEKTLNAVLAILSEDAKKYIDETTGDLNMYLTQLIEAQVNLNK